MRLRGQTRETLDLRDLLTAQYRTLLFYPSDDAVELDKELVAQDQKPIQLIVPDGTWRQASKVHVVSYSGARRIALQDLGLSLVTFPLGKSAWLWATLISLNLFIIYHTEVEPFFTASAYKPPSLLPKPASSMLSGWLWQKARLQSPGGNSIFNLT